MFALKYSENSSFPAAPRKKLQDVKDFKNSENTPFHDLDNLIYHQKHKNKDGTNPLGHPTRDSSDHYRQYQTKNVNT